MTDEIAVQTAPDTVAAPQDPVVRVPDRLVPLFLVGGGAGVIAYVTSWIVAGVITPDYDPLRQAISELFALGTPTAPRVLMIVILVVTGLGLGPFGYALERTLPVKGRVAPALVALSAIMIGLVGLFPCSFGCPGAGTTFTDTAHTTTAAIGYLALIVAPIVFGWRLREAMPMFARISLWLGGLALVGFVIRYSGVIELPLAGLQQRLLNTLADAWYVVAAVVGLRRWRAGDTT